MSDALIAGAVAAPIAIAHVALVVAAVLQIVRDRALAGLARDLWVVAAVVFPIFGAIAWFGIGHRTAAAQRAVHRVRLSL
ncbi:PLDc N-terminal domain-containing protein [Clavibacter michiganensis]|uniref:Uncharacterized protein n=1 Tax=Clavibacter michiganensis subsp. insidiosus TaxID=33014 RepID=A0A399QYX3_9MICO|nr:PLDc N-terminal domain-containing protein [Clavibacter michiganensis]AWF98031.1 hypothetical protein BEH61_05875 [Clavibacter michiganensis subsp. insidiosus]AWG01770.1 hypothetical protein BEH62_09205 [Clavibacter michiganensis subsp. insidiosus]OQJ59719.1 hypothetical protein B5P21_07220 [Clavibacter michiganensis subsp. insidiosus]RII87467.1 hypothetical protein DZF92_06785 [Clavibacter michiganensis subsp. insidiosus]RIJ22777.1 hypothetical protein DZF93_11795 [Clavibacter michiganensis